MRTRASSRSSPGRPGQMVSERLNLSCERHPSAGRRTARLARRRRQVSRQRATSDRERIQREQVLHGDDDIAYFVVEHMDNRMPAGARSGRVRRRRRRTLRDLHARSGRAGALRAPADFGRIADRNERSCPLRRSFAGDAASALQNSPSRRRFADAGRSHRSCMTRPSLRAGTTGIPGGFAAADVQDRNLRLRAGAWRSKWHLAPKEMAWFDEVRARSARADQKVRLATAGDARRIVEHSGHDPLVACGLGARPRSRAPARDAGAVRRTDGCVVKGRRGVVPMTIKLRVNGKEHALGVDPEMRSCGRSVTSSGLTGLLKIPDGEEPSAARARFTSTAGEGGALVHHAGAPGGGQNIPTIGASRPVKHPLQRRGSRLNVPQWLLPVGPDQRRRPRSS